MHPRKRRRIGKVALGFLLLMVLVGDGTRLRSAEAPLSEAWWVGAAKVDITPDYPIRLSGYGSRTNVHAGVAQRIYAKALAIGADANGPALLVTVDNCGVPASMRDELVRRLAGKTKVRGERVAVASTHTHCAPMLAGVLPNMFGADLPVDQAAAIERYTRELTDQLERVALEALARRKPSRLSWEVGQVGFAANRRAFRLKPIDHALPVLRVEGEDGAVTALFTSYACHCTTIAIDQIHGDWAGVAQAALEREFPGAIALTALGCGADQNPAPRRTMELVKQYGEAVAAEAKRLATQPLRRVGGPLACRTQVLDLPYDALPTRSEWETAAAGSGAAAYQAKKNLSRLDRGERLPTHLPYRIQTWVFGEDLAMVFLAGEVVVDYGLRLKRELDARRLWVNAYANDVPCYIPSRRILEEGGYEAVGAMIYYDRPTRLAAAVEDQIVDGVHRLLPDGFRAREPVDLMAGLEQAPEYPDHSHLGVVRDLAGRERTVETTADWAERVAHIRANVERAMGPWPGAARWASLDPFVVSEEATTNYFRRKIRYSPEPGDRVPAWLLIPKQLPASGRAPAMLCLHQTTLIGKDEPAGLGGLKTLHYAHELAERGYVCLVPDYPSFGEYSYDFQKEGRHYASGSMKAIWNNQRGVDFLETLPEVDRTRMGVIGHSLGGHNAIFTAVFDDRLKAVISSCGFTPFHDYYGGKLAGWTSDRYMPRIRTVYGNNPDRVPFDFYELLGALAPRGFYSCSPTRDDNFSVAGVRKAFARVAPVYGRMGAAEKLVLSTPDAPHEFPDAERRAAYEWLDRILK